VGAVYVYAREQACRQLLTWQGEQLELIQHRAALGLDMDKWFEDGDHVRADRLGRLPLHLAAAYGHVQVVQVRGVGV